MTRPVVLAVLDGWGIGEDNESNPIYVAKPQTFKYLTENYPLTSLLASGISIGLPWGEAGSSEVGHLTLGAGKVLYQYYPKITMAIRDKSFFNNPALKSAFAHAKENNSAVNLIGLLTKANTHASFEHLAALLEMAEKESVSNIKLHLFADGLDGEPKTVQVLLKKLPQDKLASISGRYYGMDRKDNWGLIEQAYNAMVDPSVPPVPDIYAYLSAFLQKNPSEQFLLPVKISAGKEVADNDSIIFFNFREDGIRQMAEAFILPSFEKFKARHFQNLYITTLTKYEDSLTAPAAFQSDMVKKCLGEVLSDSGKSQLRLAESYKYAHVTYFFDNYREEPFKNEYRVLVPSLGLTHPDEKPELMAREITDRLVEAIQNRAFDFILVNYSNPDTIGHSGNYNACLEAVKVIDQEMARVVKAVESTDSVLLITSDHGKIERELNPATGVIETQHQSNPVPLHVVAKEYKGKRFPNSANLKDEILGILSDVAPTILAIMGLPQPEEMTGRSLLTEIK